MVDRPGAAAAEDWTEIRNRRYLVVDAEGEDLAAVEDLDGEVAAGADVARVLHLAEVAFPEGPPDLIPPQQRRPRALRPRRLAVHHSQTHARRIGLPRVVLGSPLSLSLCLAGLLQLPTELGSLGWMEPAGQLRNGTERNGTADGWMDEAGRGGGGERVEGAGYL